MNSYEDFNRGKNKKLSFETECFEWISTMISAIVVLVIIFTIFLKLIIVNGESMTPTLHDKDWMALNSFLYVPKKGDIVVIKKRESLKEPIIKRVIATENDIINIEDGKVYVNGELQNEKSYIGEVDTLNYGDMAFPQIVPDKCCFVLGDNRENSLDSRFEKIGFVNRSEILGEAKVIVFPFNRLKIT